MARSKETKECKECGETYPRDELSKRGFCRKCSIKRMIRWHEDEAKRLSKLLDVTENPLQEKEG